MIDRIPPGFIFILGALLVPLLKGNFKKALLLIIPIVGMINLINLPEGNHTLLDFLYYKLILIRVDRLSLLFGYIFHIISFIGFLYALHLDDDLQHVAALVYAGSALGVVFAGDFFTFFIFWEMLTVSSIFLIWARRTKRSQGAGFRYLLVHVAGGLCLFAGIILRLYETGSIEFGYIGLNGLSSYLIFFGFGLNCAWPLLHPWLVDAYPEATITGTIFMSAFTTKCAVYALARAFPGTHALIWIGAFMTAFPIFYAVIENDLRRVLSYSLINQVGFMVCGIGIGTHLSLNGAVSHAFNDILFKALLFMAMGAVMFRTGRINATALGGLYKTMPLTCIFCMVGAASISAFPLFSGFVSKSMVMEAAAEQHMPIIWFILLFASAGVFHHAGIKIPYFAFFSHDSGLRPREAPLNMLLAMGVTAFLCIFIGSYPWPLYRLLPYQDVAYNPYSGSHVIWQTQLLFFSALAFTLLILSGIYPPEQRYVNLDIDWIYRKGVPLLLKVINISLGGIQSFCHKLFVDGIAKNVAKMSIDGTYRLSLVFLEPLWFIRGIRGKDLKKKKREVHRMFQTGTVPLGLKAVIATIFLIVLLLLI